MAIAFINAEKYHQAEIEAKKTGGDIVEIYKKLGGAYKEGTNEEIERTFKFTAKFDEEKSAKTKAKKIEKKK